MSSNSFINAIVSKNFGSVRHLIENDIRLRSHFNIPIYLGQMPLHVAVSSQSRDQIVKTLLQHGMSINTKDTNGLTPLHIAVLHNPQVLHVLLQYGANPNIQNNYKETPLIIALKKRESKFAKILLQHGSDPNIQDSLGFTALHIALVQELGFDVIKMLLEKGADANIKNHRNCTPLYNAAGNHRIVKLLLEHGADIHITNDTQNLTALFAAIISNSPESVKLLIEQGSDINFSTTSAFKPLVFAIYEEHRSVIRILLNYGADVHFSEFINNQIVRFRHSKDSGILSILLSHFIKLRNLNLVDDNFLSFWKLNLQEYFESLEDLNKKSEIEAEKMRKTIFCPDNNVTLADILLKSPRKVAVYMNVGEIKKRLEEINFQEEFPVYCDMLQAKIKMCTIMGDFLNKSYTSLCKVLGDNRLPHMFLTEVMSFLSDKDNKVLNKIASTM